MDDKKIIGSLLVFFLFLQRKTNHHGGGGAGRILWFFSSSGYFRKLEIPFSSPDYVPGLMYHIRYIKKNIFHYIFLEQINFRMGEKG